MTTKTDTGPTLCAPPIVLLFSSSYLHHLHHEGDNLTPSPHALLFLDDDFDAAIPRPAFRIVGTIGIRIGCDRTFFPIPVRRHALAPQVIHNEFVRYGFGAGERQRTVVTELAYRVGVSLNGKIPLLRTRVVKNRGYRVDRFARFGIEVCAAKAEKHVRESNDNASVRFSDVELLFA
jgi:hypothetical protein